MSRNKPRFREKVRLRGVFTAVIVLLYCCGCSVRSYTPPHSEILADARSQGLRIPDAAKENYRFEQYERRARERLKELFERRESLGLSGQSYRIGSGDKIEINVFDVPELNLQVRVRDSGFVSLPLIGALRATGKTETELQQDLKTRLATYVKQPELSIFISEYGSQKVSVIGAVSAPGSYALKRGGNSLLEILSEAGGISDTAGNYLHFIPIEVTSQSSSHAQRSRASLSMSRYAKSSPQGIELYLEDVLGTSGSVPVDIPVRGGDMIIVPEAGNVLIEGEVEKRGSYELGKRMTLLGALAAAGGITSAAKVDEIEIVRTFAPGENARLILSLEQILSGSRGDVSLRNGDIVRVPSHSGRRLSEDTMNGFRQMLNVGVGASVTP